MMVIFLMMFLVIVINTDTDDDYGKKEGRWRRLLAARQPGKKESESVDLHARRLFINKVLTLSLSLTLSLTLSLPLSLNLTLS